MVWRARRGGNNSKASSRDPSVSSELLVGALDSSPHTNSDVSGSEWSTSVSLCSTEWPPNTLTLSELFRRCLGSAGLCVSRVLDLGLAGLLRDSDRRRDRERGDKTRARESG